MLNEHIKFPQRKIKKSYRSVTGHFPSVKNNKSVAFESLLEKAHYLCLEFDDSVIGYYEQPQVEISFNGKNVLYSVDSYVIKDKNSNLKDTLIEVKYTNELEKRKKYFEEKFKATKDFASKYNLIFETFTENSYSKVYLENIDLLYRYRLKPIELKYEKEILDIVSSNKRITAYEISQKISKSLVDYAKISNDIWALVSNGQLSTELHNNEITMNSFLELKNV